MPASTIYHAALISLALGISAKAYSAESFGEGCGFLKSAFDFEGQSALFEKYKRVSEGPNELILAPGTIPWAGYYWPMHYGGIAVRWQKSKKDFDYPLLDEGRTQEQVLALLKAMPAAELSQLSPVEKYDIHKGYYDFRTTKVERKNRGHEREPKPEKWEGFCNGRCAAAINLPEPKNSITTQNPDGIRVDFAINDLKALGAANYFYVEKYAQLGLPAGPHIRNQKRLVDPPNAGALDIALRGYVGGVGKGFVVDYHKGGEIWNLTLVGYKRFLDSRKDLFSSERKYAPKEAAYQQDVLAEVKLLEEVGIEESNTVTSQAIAENLTHVVVEKWKYRLYLDVINNIVGGRYLRNQGPDFVWFSSGKGMESAYGVNSHLEHETIKRLFELGATPRSPSGQR